MLAVERAKPFAPQAGDLVSVPDYRRGRQTGKLVSWTARRAVVEVTARSTNRVHRRVFLPEEVQPVDLRAHKKLTGHSGMFVVHAGERVEVPVGVKPSAFVRRLKAGESGPWRQDELLDQRQRG